MPVNLQHYTTFRTLAYADNVVSLTHIEQLPELAKPLLDSDFMVVGSGSNILFADDFHGTVVHNQLRGIHVASEDENTATVCIAAGEIWHDTVLDLSQRGFYGLENLALIPGTVGAAPVQNIGAYGVEVADFIVSVDVFDLSRGAHTTLTADECQFAYRDSIFKQANNRNRHLITATTLTLSKTFTPNLSYKGLAGEPVPQTAAELIQRVIEVRQSKLPDPDHVPNAGSFFKNPLVNRRDLPRLQAQFAHVPYFAVDDTHVKIPAAWLIETAGFKGHQRNNGAGVYDKHALILVNRGNAHGREIYALACDIMVAVKEQFAIDITPEVRIVGVKR